MSQPEQALPRSWEARPTAGTAQEAGIAAPRARRRVRLRPGRLLVTVLAMYLAGTAIHGEARYLEMRSQVQKLQEQSYRLQALDRTLRSQVRQLLSPAFAAQLARTQMGYVSPGEIPLVVTPLPAGHRRSPQG